MEDGVWRTIGGRRVFIKHGQDLATAMRESGKFGNKKQEEQPQQQEKEFELSEDNINQVISESVSKWEDNYAKLYMTKMSPDDFLKLTIADEEQYLLKEGNFLRSMDNVDTNILHDKKYVADMMYLSIDLENQNVIGHEGRHRMMLLKEAGYKQVDVVIWASNYDKYNAKEYKNFTVNGQEKQFNKQVTFNDLVPVSKANIERIKKHDY